MALIRYLLVASVIPFAGRCRHVREYHGGLGGGDTVFRRRDELVGGDAGIKPCGIEDRCILFEREGVR